MRCSIAILFTCVLVLSCPVVKWGCMCETWIVGTNSKILGGPRHTRKVHVEEGRQEIQSNPRTSHDRRICKVLQESSHSSMYKVYDNVTYAKEKKTEMSWVFCLQYICSCLIVVHDYLCLHLPDFSPTDCLFFCRLKINHDSHEFILEFGTNANTYNLIMVTTMQNQDHKYHK